MYAIIGLGNHGKEYENTRHNMGFKTLDILAQKTGAKMNNSGIAAREVLEYYKIEEENLLVIYDDADLDEGTIRIRPFGSSGSHNGMKSIIYQLYSDRFPRIRIGIGKPEYDMINYVTGGLPKEKMEEFAAAWENAADAAICFVESGIETAMNKYNPPKKKKEEKPVEES